MLKVRSLFGRGGIGSSEMPTIAQDRYRRILIAALAGGGARTVSMAVSLVSVPIVLRHLGSERFGLWVTVISLVGVTSFADLGLGNGLINVLARAHGRDDTDRAGTYLSSAFYVLLVLGAMIAIVFLFAYPIIDWATLFNAKTPRARAETAPAMLALVLCTSMSLPLSVAQRTHLAYQEGFKASIGSAIGSIGGFVGLLVAIALDAGLPWLVLAFAGGPVLGGGINWLMIWFGRSWLRPHLTKVSLKATREVARLGVLFLVLGIASAISYNTDNLVIARIMGAEQVTVFSIPFKLFFIVPTLLGFGLQALWPAYGEALARGDVVWVRRALRRSFSVSLGIAIPAALLLGFFGKWVIALWVGPSLDPPRLLLAGLALWVVLNGLSGSIAAFFNGASIISFQVWTASLATLANLVLSIILVRRIGVAGAILGTCAAQIAFIILPSFLAMSRLFRKVSMGSVAANSMVPLIAPTPQIATDD